MNIEQQHNRAVRSSKWLGVFAGSIGYTVPLSLPASFLLLWAHGLHWWQAILASMVLCVAVGSWIFFMRRNEWDFKRHTQPEIKQR